MTVKYQDYYKTLGVERSATPDQIQSAYRKLARQYHPDVNKDPAAAETFKLVNEAYEVLKDPEKRKRYDELGSNWKAGQDFKGWNVERDGSHVRVDLSDFMQGVGGNDSHFSDFFEAIFGGSGRMRDPFSHQPPRPSPSRSTRASASRSADPRHPRATRKTPSQHTRPRAHEVAVNIPLSLAYHGGTHEIRINLQQQDDSGALNTTTKTFEVKVPRGTLPGAKIRLPGQAGAGPSGDNEDIVLVFTIDNDPRFTLDGQNLRTTVPITPWEAALGAPVTVPTIDGDVVMTVPPGSSSGRRLRLRGKGMPPRDPQDPDQPGAHGDLVVELRIVVPPQLTDEERDAFQTLARISTFKPRDAT